MVVVNSVRVTDQNLSYHFQHIWLTFLLFQSLLNVGAIFGGPVAGFLIGSIGRKATLMACAVPFAVGWALIASVPYVWGLYLGRVLTGFATGMTTLACPVSTVIQRDQNNNINDEIFVVSFDNF